MAIPISPGVYTKIIDLSTYVQAVPGTIGFAPIISRKGPDNKLTFVAGTEDFTSLFGKPNITDYGKTYGQGPYICYNHLQVSTSLYVIRCLPDDATYSNLFLVANTDATARIEVESHASQNTITELDTTLETVVGTKTPIAYFICIGRGDYYDNIGIRISEHANPQVTGIYILDVYETQSDGDDQIIESFEVSFDELALDDSGESVFIEDILNRYSKVVRCKTNTEGIDVVAVNNLNYSQPFATANAVHLDEGSEGTLVNIDTVSGRVTINSTTATQILSQAYIGLIDDEVINLDDIYFTLVWDCGYPSDVKTAISTLVNDIRRDCVAILDNGDNASYSDTIDARTNTHTFNSRYLALYESYSKVYDVFTGRDIWVSPVYHMANLIPLNDRLYEIWRPTAGFNRATIDKIKELRYNPKLGQRDQLYLSQINPIVKFNVGYTVWGQLTSQKKPSKLQDLHAMRAVLYIKRALEQFCKFYIFEYNEPETWNSIQAGIVPFLDFIRSRKGLESFSVEVGATEYEKKAKICHVNVTLVPMPVIEKIQLNLFIK